ncbi:protein kinase [Streptomyces sp. NPDC007251]|uniref:serine/threonine-protein kinase n=1 Tax=Streptomyces sp. NPDC007251 TaxID=3154483 RepID=UPI0033CC38D4
MSGDGEHPPDARLIGGRYRLAGRLGSGPTGTVWRARDVQHEGVRVALKEPSLPGDPADDEDSRRIAHRLYREARAAARVRHPSAVTVYDVVTEGHVPWIVMELVEGESLREVLRRGPLPVPEAARIGLAVLGALRAAHAVGIVHRDVKPSNVLLESGTGRVVVTDFGTGDGHPGAVPAGFAAPERAAGPGAGPASDLWSLGALLRAALADTDPGPLCPLLDRLHADEPEARPGAEEVTAALRSYLGVTPAAPPGTAPDPAQAMPADTAPDPAQVMPAGTAVDPAQVTPAGTAVDPAQVTPAGTAPDPAQAMPAGTAPDSAEAMPANTAPDPAEVTPAGTAPDPAQVTPAGTAPAPAPPARPGPTTTAPDPDAAQDAAPAPASAAPRRRTPRTTLGMLLARKAGLD